MANLQFQTNSPIEPEKLMSYITDFENYQKFFPHQIKSIKILDRQDNEITTEETIIFSTLIKSAFTQKSHHKLVSDKELFTEIIEGPAKGSMIKIVCTKDDQGSQIKFDVDMIEYDLDFHNQFYHSGYLIDTDIPEEKARQFIKKHESTFDTLSDEFIKKINYFKK